MTALYFTKNIIYLFLFYQIGQIVVGIASYKWYVPKESKSTPHDIYNKYISYSKHTSVRNIISNISSRLDIVIIFTQLGAADLALYSIATIIPEQIKGTFKNLGTLLLPKYSNHKDIDVIKRGVPKRSFQLLIALIIITILYIIISPYVYSLLFPKYPEAIFYSMLSALSFPSFIALIPISVIQSSLDKKTLYMTNLQDALIGTILIYALTISYGITGTILARVITRYINVFYLYNKLTR
jgi:O-antigen/teichoic acid export membrane protein